MSGFIVVALAGLLLQDAQPHPSTQASYQAPVIRPFEPPSDFGRERAQGDENGDAHRRPLEAPVAVDAYARSYEYSPSDSETAYDQGVASAEIRADQTAGPLDGRWRMTDAQGRTICDLVLSDAGGLVEGGWRAADGSGVVTVENEVLTLAGLGTLSLQADGAGWRGTLAANGRTGPATLSRPR